MIDRPTDSSQNTWLDDRAVSELVGFVLVFGVILGSVGLLYATGFQAMGDYQEHEQQVNAERAMEALADNFNDLMRYDGIDERSGELSLRDGTIRTGDDGTTLRILVDGDPITDDSPFDDVDNFSQLDTNELNLGEFTYTSDGQQVVYEGSGLVRADDSGSGDSVLKRPHVKCGERTAVISLVAVSAADQSIQSSSGTEFTMSKQERASKVYDDVDSVTIEIAEDDTAYESAWESILDTGGDDGWSWDDDDEEGTCDGDDLERAIVTIVEVDIEY